MALNWAPLFHDMGLLVSVFQTVIDGTKSLMMSPIMFMQNPVSWLRNIQKYKVTASGAPNFAYELCIHKIPLEKCEGLDLSTWKLAYNSAEPVRAETQSAFAEKFAPYRIPSRGLCTLLRTGRGHAGSIRIHGRTEDDHVDHQPQRL